MHAGTIHGVTAVNFQDAIRSCFRQYVGFAGRASRSEYWLFVLFTVLGSMVASILDLSIFGYAGLQPFGAIFSLVLFLPTLAVAVRRLHDLDRSGWWLLVAFLPLVGWVVLLVWFITKSDPIPNRFGPVPLPAVAA